MNRVNFLLIIVLFLISFNPSILEAWDEFETHTLIAEEAIKHSILSPSSPTKASGDYLENLGFTGNLREKFLGPTLNEEKKPDEDTNDVEEWIINGSIVEDQHDRSLMNHFHDPLRNWSEAGLELSSKCSFFLKIPLFGLLGCHGESSLIWATDSENLWSWQSSRNYYYAALTSKERSDREESFAKTFRGIGQLIHLVQDVSQPAHVRNDPHALDAKRWANGFETWAVNNADKVNLLIQNPVFPPDSLLDSGDIIPIMELFDTKQFSSQGNPPNESKSAGLAEYTNANFLSEDTIRYDYPWPSLEEPDAKKVLFSIDRRFKKTVTRSYYRKVCSDCGEDNLGLGYILAAESITEKYVKGTTTEKIKTILDDTVYDGYAGFLFPRAVGYSTALIDYFFRGTMEITVADDKSFTLKNTSKEDMTNGVVEICYDDTSGNRNCYSSAIFSLLQKKEITLQAEVGGNLELPEGVDSPAMAVYRGQLGSEKDAVVGKAIGFIPSVPPSTDPSDPPLPPLPPLPPEPDLNLPPIVVGDNASTNNNISVVIVVLANDFDPDGTIDTSSLLVVGSPSNGKVTVQSGAVLYTPTEDFIGDDSFTYSVADNDGAIGSAVVNVSVLNLPPIVLDDDASTDMNISVVIAVLANDSDPDGSIDTSSLLLVSVPSNGSVSVSSGGILYAPKSDFSGEDSFTYSVADNVGAIGFATVSVTVKAEDLFKIISENRAIWAGVGTTKLDRSDVSSPGGALSPRMVEVKESLTDLSSKSTAEQDMFLGVTENSISLSGKSSAVWTIRTGNQGASDATIYFSLYKDLNYEFSGLVEAVTEDQGHVQSFVSLLDSESRGISVHNLFEWSPMAPNLTWKESGILKAGTYILRANTNSFSNFCGSCVLGTANGSFSFSFSLSEIK